MSKLLFFLSIFLVVWPAYATDYKPNVLDQTYEHDHWGTSANCIIKDFRAYRSCFDDADDDNNDGISDIWGIPQWVAYEIKKTDELCIKTHARPSTWITDRELFSQGLMPSDDSYKYPLSFTKIHKDWFARGHLAMKMHAERLGGDAAWNTHTFYNAVPQRQLFNAGIWQDMENLTAAWAQEYSAVWIITGPIFADKSPTAYIGEQGELPVAIPDALFKIIIKKSDNPEKPDVLAFIYPQVGAGYYEGTPYDHTRYITNIGEIEKLTGLDFLMILPDIEKKEIEQTVNKKLWPVHQENFVKACTGSAYNE